MSLYRLDASINPSTSQSRALADLVEAEWTSEHPDSLITRRDIGTQPLPATTWRDAVLGGFTAEPTARPSSARPAPSPPPSSTSWSTPTRSCSPSRCTTGASPLT